MDEIQQAKAKFARMIEDGRKIQAFTSMPEYQWYVENVVKPTIDENIEKVMRGKLNSEKEDWITRGIVMGMRMMIETPESFLVGAENAKKQAKGLAKYERSLEDEQL